MKIRLDFVTNSSSSSFILGIKGELTKDRLLEVFKVDPISPLYSFAKDLSQLIVNKANGRWGKIDIEELISDYGSIEELPEKYKKALDNGMELYRISADNDSDGVEMALYNMVLNYISDDLIIESED